VSEVIIVRKSRRVVNSVRCETCSPARVLCRFPCEGLIWGCAWFCALTVTLYPWKGIGQELGLWNEVFQISCVCVCVCVCVCMYCKCQVLVKHFTCPHSGFNRLGLTPCEQAFQLPVAADLSAP